MSIVSAGNRIRQHDLSLYWGQVNFNWLIPWLSVCDVFVCAYRGRTHDWCFVAIHFYRHIMFVQWNLIWTSMKPNMPTLKNNIPQCVCGFFCKLFLSFHHRFELIISFYLEMKRTKSERFVSRILFMCVNFDLGAFVVNKSKWYSPYLSVLCMSKSVSVLWLTNHIIIWRGEKNSVILWSPHIKIFCRWIERGRTYTLTHMLARARVMNSWPNTDCLLFSFPKSL